MSIGPHAEQNKRLVNRMISLHWRRITANTIGEVIQVTLSDKLPEAQRENAKKALEACGATPVNSEGTIWRLRGWKISFG